MFEAEFSTAFGNSIWPTPPTPQSVVSSLRFDTCPGGDLRLIVAKVEDPTLERGVPLKAWWVITSKNMPDRFLCMSGGYQSLSNFIRRYGFLDADGCLNHEHGIVTFADKVSDLKEYPVDVPEHLKDACGVPQHAPDSGICWYASMCWISFACLPLRKFLFRYLPVDLQKLAQESIRSPPAAEELRRRLWFDYAVGDKWGKAPHLEGQNGLTQFLILCANLKAPILRFRDVRGCLQRVAPNIIDQKGKSMKLAEPNTMNTPHILVLRYYRGDHHKKCPISRRLVLKGKRYRLVGVYMGKMQCGHQTGAVSTTGSWRRWSLGDADLHKDKIHPIHIHFKPTKYYRGSPKEGLNDWSGPEWWYAWEHLVHVTKFGAGNTQKCNMNLHNHSDALYMGVPKARPGSLNCDVVYISEDVAK